MSTLRRKRRVSFNIPGHAHFLTFSCYQRLPLLSKDRSRQWVVDCLERARQKVDFALWAYVIMPEHVHLLIRPRQPAYEMRRILAVLKRPVAVQAKAHLLQTGNFAWVERLTVREGKEAVFRFWQAGGGYDENLWNERPIEEVIEYIHANPVRRGLVQQATAWAWSSARFWAGFPSFPLAMDPLPG
jgi:putative transposase